MSFDDSSSCMDNDLGMIHGESSTIPPHYKALARTPVEQTQVSTNEITQILT